MTTVELVGGTITAHLGDCFGTVTCACGWKSTLQLHGMELLSGLTEMLRQHREINEH